MSDHAEARYQRDPQFKALVDTFHAYIYKAEFSPTEIREAAMLAHIHYAMTECRPFMIKVSDPTLSEFARFVRDGQIGIKR